MPRIAVTCRLGDGVHVARLLPRQTRAAQRLWRGPREARGRRVVTREEIEEACLDGVSRLYGDLLGEHRAQQRTVGLVAVADRPELGRSDDPGEHRVAGREVGVGAARAHLARADCSVS
jgi:hypothetical protein